MIRTVARHLIVVPATAIGALIFGVLAHQQINVMAQKQQVARQDLSILREGINGEIDLLQRQLSEDLATGQVSQAEINQVKGQIATLEMIVNATTTTRPTTTTTRATTTTVRTTTTQPSTTTTTTCLVFHQICR